MTLQRSNLLAGLASVPVILATDSRDPSGMGQHMIALAGHVGPSFAPHLAFQRSPAGRTFVARARSAGIRAEIVDEGEWPGWIARQTGPLLHVHAGIGWEGHELVALGRRAGMSVVRTEHLPWLLDDPSRRQDYAAMLGGVQQLVTVSRGAALSWQAALQDMRRQISLSAIPNGIAPQRPGIPARRLRASLGIDDAPFLLHVGRFTHQKAQATLVAAFAEVRTAHPTSRLVMVGSGPLQDAIAEQVRDLGLTGVSILAPRDDIASLMQAADLFVLPSLFEGLPIVLLEAMAAELPIVATAIHGNTDALGSGHPFLVPPDQPSALAACIGSVLADPAQARAVAVRQKDRFRRLFSAREMAKATETTYTRALADRRARQRRPMQAQTRVGFIGAGGIAERHLGVLATFPDVAVTAVADPDLPRATAAAERHGGVAYPSADAMLDGTDLDALFICVPPFAHGAAERLALASALPFFVEKPLAADLASAEDIAAEVAAAQLITGVGYHWRYLDTVDIARRALGDRQPQLLQGFWLDQTPPPTWWGRQGQSGGQVVEQVTHLVDTLRLLAGGVTSVYAQGNHLPRDRYPDLDVSTSSTATLTFASGAVAALSSTCLLDWSHRVGVHLFAEGLAIELSDQEVMVDTGHGRHPRRVAGDPVWREDRDFIDAVRGRPNQIRTSYAEALETHRVATALARSMETGEIVHLSPVLPQPLPPVGRLRRPTAHPRHDRHVRSLSIEAPFRAGFFGYDEGPAEQGQVRMDMCFSGLSAGTELTFLKGTNPYLSASWDGDAGVFRQGSAAATYPVRFTGYMEVARIVDSQAEGYNAGDLVAATFGHKTGHTATAATDLLVRLPGTLDPILGIFVAQMGPIAANGILHADALVGPAGDGRLGSGVRGRRVAVWGGGTVGLFTALFARASGAEAVLIAEPSAFRRGLAERLGFVALDEESALAEAKTWGSPGDRGADLVFQTRARSDSLHVALRALRPQTTVIDLAFYQGGMEGLRLGEEFHHNGLRIQCAQIGRVPPGFGPVWTRSRLSEETLALLAIEGVAVRDAMITHVVSFDEAPSFLSRLVEDRPEFLQIVFALDP
jgi:predicted dehydrogenase/glycosyltransferase involved in cell wall biosynthesis/NADPH:quinone reductase-like Zn-dependent oxidoreductase